MSPPLLTIIIVSWNEWPKLRACLASIQASRLPTIQTIVVDNHSTDGTPGLIRKRFPEFELYENATNLGHTKAVNQGFRSAAGKYILVLDSDTELAPDCIELLTRFIDAHPEVVMVAPRTFNSDGTVQESARNFPGVMSGLFGRQSALTRLFPGNPISHRYLARNFLSAREPFEVEQIGGACMFFRRSLIDFAGPWDERYAGYWVDTDWCRKVRQKGLRIYCVPEAHVTHHENNARGKRKSARRIWMFHRGAYRYYAKWHSRGFWDPRSLFAGTMLYSRALVLILVNRFRPGDETGGAGQPTRIEALAPEQRRPK